MIFPFFDSSLFKIVFTKAINTNKGDIVNAEITQGIASQRPSLPFKPKINIKIK